MHGNQLIMAGLKPGDFAPMFITESSVNPQFRMDTTGGRRVVLFFLGSSKAPGALEALAALAEKRGFFEEQRTLVFVVSIDPADRAGPLPTLAAPHVVFWDLRLDIARKYGLVPPQPEGSPTVILGSMVLDENSRIVGFVPLGAADRHADEVAAAILSIAPLPPARQVTHQPPVLLVPDVIPADYCRQLIRAYEAHGGVEGGSLVDIGDKTVHVRDGQHKRRSDWHVGVDEILAPLHAGIAARVAPEVRKAFHFPVSALERNLIGCYDAESGGYFRPHRDDNTIGTSHRRYALTINLNSEAYEGGDLRFPEYSLDTYRPPTGGAIVFSCSLMHEVLPVTKGRRYAFVSFLLSADTAAQLSAFIEEQTAAGRRGEFVLD